MRDDDDANKEGEERRERTSPFELKLTTVYLFVKSYIYIYKYICNVKRERHVDVTHCRHPYFMDLEIKYF
jgi:hypothetical protein